MKTNHLILIPLALLATLSAGCVAHVTATVLDGSGNPLPPGTEGTFTLLPNSPQQEDFRDFKATSGKDSKFKFDVIVKNLQEEPRGRLAHFTLASDPSKSFGCKKTYEGPRRGEVPNSEVDVSVQCSERATSEPMQTFTGHGKVIPSSDPVSSGAAGEGISAGALPKSK